jgi:hypothetical protein
MECSAGTSLNRLINDIEERGREVRYSSGRSRAHDPSCRMECSAGTSLNRLINYIEEGGGEVVVEVEHTTHRVKWNVVQAPA